MLSILVTYSLYNNGTFILLFIILSDNIEIRICFRIRLLDTCLLFNVVVFVHMHILVLCYEGHKVE